MKALRAAATDLDQPPADAEKPPPPEGRVVVTSSDLADALAVMAEAFLAGKVAGADDADVYQVVIHAGTDAIAADPAPPADVSAETPPPAPVPAPSVVDPADPARCHVEDGSAISVTTAQMVTCSR